MEADKELLLEGFDLRIQPGEKVLLAGDSGTGKSSFLSALLGFQTIQGGKLEVFGQAVDDTQVWGVREQTAYLPQEYELKLDSVRELFYFPFSFKQNRSLRPSEEEVKEAIERFGLKPHMLDRDPDGISGGEKQRLVAASLLKLRKPLYLLDEPSASLDPGWTGTMADAFLEDADRTVIAVAHDPEWRRKVDRIIELPSGKEQAHG
jgi:ABC-type multidrug transport system ATPase subunit